MRNTKFFHNLHFEVSAFKTIMCICVKPSFNDICIRLVSSPSNGRMFCLLTSKELVIYTCADSFNIIISLGIIKYSTVLYTSSRGTDENDSILMWFSFAFTLTVGNDLGQRQFSLNQFSSIVEITLFLFDLQYACRHELLIISYLQKVHMQLKMPLGSVI